MLSITEIPFPSVHCNRKPLKQEFCGLYLTCLCSGATAQLLQETHGPQANHIKGRNGYWSKKVTRRKTLVLVTFLFPVAVATFPCAWVTRDLYEVARLSGMVVYHTSKQPDSHGAKTPSGFFPLVLVGLLDLVQR